MPSTRCSIIPEVRAISFVGSTPVARYVYSRAAANGKRVQCQGGAKNPIVVLPDADMDMTTKIVADSAFGCAGQRCLASSVVITVAEAEKTFTQQISDAASSRKIGYGMDKGTEMGPVISADSKTRIEGLIAQGVAAGAKPLVDGRNARVEGYVNGHFLRPTVLANVDPASELARTEVFGPVLSVMRADNVDEAIEIINRSPFGNMACLFTTSGAAARQFRYEARVGNVGINVGVAAPMAYFPFSGWKDSFFGDLHAQGRDAIDFYTEKKVVVERWPTTWSREILSVARVLTLDPVSKPNVPRSTWIISALALAVVGLAIPVVRHLREVPPPPPPPLTLTLGAPPDAELGSGDEPLDAAISPDERHIVFVATRAGTTMLWRRALESDRAERACRH